MSGASKKPRLTLVRVNERRGVHPFLSEANVSGVYPPLGVAYLAGAARRAGFPVSIIEAHAQDLSHQQVAIAIANIKPDVVGITSTTFNWPVVAELARSVRRAYPSAGIWVGGPQLSLYPEECMDAEAAVDVAVLGEGDETVVELLERLERGEELAGVPGTLVRGHGEDGAGEVVAGPGRAPIAELDTLALPAIDLLPLHRYRSLTLPTPYVSMTTTRGCPYRCRYCSQVYVGGSYREHGVDRVVTEMNRAVSDFGAREIVFFDETFSLSRRRTMALCEAILARGPRVRWNVRTRADLLPDELLVAMADAGCCSIHVGIEAGAERVRQLMNKRLDLAKAERALGQARRLGIETRGYFMLGYPGETRDEMEQTMALARDLPLDWASFSITQPLPRTGIHEDLLAQAPARGDYWSDYALLKATHPPGCFESEGIDAGVLDTLLHQAYRRFYLRPTVLADKLRDPRLWKELPSIVSTLLETGALARIR